jgi:hypothetical protein
MENLDHEDLNIPDESGFNLLMAVYARASKVYIQVLLFRCFNGLNGLVDRIVQLYRSRFHCMLFVGHCGKIPMPKYHF